MPDNFRFAKKPAAQRRGANERRAAIARAAMAPPDTSPAPAGTRATLRAAWDTHCQGSSESPERADAAQLGRVRIASRGSLSSLRRGDLVLVWDDHRNARTAIFSVWHPRNPILTGVSKDHVDLVVEAGPAGGVFCVPGRREDGSDAAWFDVVTRKRVPAPRRRRKTGR